MFDIECVRITNFKSYAGDHTFKVPKTPGLYNLGGENLANPRLGPNGTGKSTLLDAIYWCLYGKTSRGLKSWDVITTGLKHCKVSVDIVVGEHKATIARQQNPNELTIDYDGPGHPCPQEEVTKFLRMEADAFLYAIMIPQFGESFFDLSASNKLTLFSQILGLDLWLEKSKKAATLAAELLAEKNTLEQAKARHEATLDAALADIQTLKKLDAQYSKDQEQELNKLKNTLRGLAKEADGFNKAVVTARNAFAGAEERTVGALDRLTALTVKCTEAQDKLKEAKSKLATFREQFSDIGTVKGTCPTCLQEVSVTHLKAEKRRLQILIDDVEQLVEKHTSLERAAYKSFNTAEADVRAINQNREDFESEIKSLQYKIKATAEKQDTLAASIKAETNRPSPYKGQISSKQRDVSGATASLYSTLKEITLLEQDHVAVSYWINGFKRLRLFIIEETLGQLELEVNNNLGALGLTDWRVEFDVERENKAGGVTKGFVVLVHPPDAKAPMRFEAWSGGETQRLRLAGDLGLANLITHRAGLTSAIEFFDEPSRHLSREGMLDLAETLYQRAVDSSKRIFLVDHHNIDFGDFAGRITAVKDDEGSYLVFGD